jgi:alpha-glucosidase
MNKEKINMKRSRLMSGWAMFLLVLCLHPGYAQEYKVTSPNGLLQLRVDVGPAISYQVQLGDQQLIAPSAISMTLNNGLILGRNGTVRSTEAKTINETITPLYGKNKELRDHYQELRINFEQAYTLVLRAYDEGVAYRFQTELAGEVLVESEEASFNFAAVPSVIFPEADAAMQSWERSYTTYPTLQAIDAARFAVTPTLFSYEEQGIRMVIAESDLLDYPGMYLQRNGTNGVKGKWAHYPKTVSEPDNLYAYHRVLERENYLAKTSGTRLYPWRVLIVSQQDKDLLHNELVYKLARPQVLTNTSWIKPGKSAWEWWHDALLESSQIPSGPHNLNFNLYKIYVDFAAENKLEYITMDAGWSMDYAAAVCQYAAGKNVKVFLWDFINLPVVNPERLTQIKNIGAAGVKIDLIERDDQVAINWFEQLAKACADRELMIIFHGNAKPTGLQRAYPNILNFEAVRGAECAKWDDTPNPDYHLQFPFIRMLAGPLDYTPGSMRNVHMSDFKPIPTGIPNTMGTRSHELAMYVAFDQPLAYLCDSPTEYRKNRVVMNFLSKVPSVWEETIPLDAKVGQYLAMARRKGEEWYVGAMTSNQGREIEIDFSFLPEGRQYTAEVYRDNEQTAANAKAYTFEIVTVNSQSRLKYKLASGGGVAMRLQGTVTGIKEDKERAKFRVFPNADHSQLYIQAKEKIRSLTIIDAAGKSHHYQDLGNRHQARHQVSIGMLAAGLHMAIIETATDTHSFKFMK